MARAHARSCGGLDANVTKTGQAQRMQVSGWERGMEQEAGLTGRGPRDGADLRGWRSPIQVSITVVTPTRDMPVGTFEKVAAVLKASTSVVRFLMAQERGAKLEHGHAQAVAEVTASSPTTIKLFERRRAVSTLVASWTHARCFHGGCADVTIPHRRPHDGPIARYCRTPPFTSMG